MPCLGVELGRDASYASPALGVRLQERGGSAHGSIDVSVSLVRGLHEFCLGWFYVSGLLSWLMRVFVFGVMNRFGWRDGTSMKHLKFAGMKYSFNEYLRY